MTLKHEEQLEYLLGTPVGWEFFCGYKKRLGTQKCNVSSEVNVTCNLLR
jgi:hypothetical protein